MTATMLRSKFAGVEERGFTLMGQHFSGDLVFLNRETSPLYINPDADEYTATAAAKSKLAYKNHASDRFYRYLYAKYGPEDLAGVAEHKISMASEVELFTNETGIDNPPQTLAAYVSGLKRKVIPSIVRVGKGNDAVWRFYGPLHGVNVESDKVAELKEGLTKDQMDEFMKDVREPEDSEIAPKQELTLPEDEEEDDEADLRLAEAVGDPAILEGTPEEIEEAVSNLRRLIQASAMNKYRAEKARADAAEKRMADVLELLGKVVESVQFLEENVVQFHTTLDENARQIRDQVNQPA